MLFSPPWDEGSITNIPTFMNNSFTTKPYSDEPPETILTPHATVHYCPDVANIFALHKMQLEYITLSLFLQPPLYFKPL